jgi:hypothetical protein
MPVSSREQIIIQSMIDTATPEERRQLYAEAEETLGNANLIAGQRLLTSAESKEIDLSVEMIVRIEATERKKGPWFRFKRRLQVVQMYMGA